MYAKDVRSKCKQVFKEGNAKLNKAEENNDNFNAKLIRDKLKLLEDEHLADEWLKCKMFNILEDERPSKTSLPLSHVNRDTMKSVNSI